MSTGAMAATAGDEATSAKLHASALTETALRSDFRLTQRPIRRPMTTSSCGRRPRLAPAPPSAVHLPRSSVNGVWAIWATRDTRGHDLRQVGRCRAAQPRLPTGRPAQRTPHRRSRPRRKVPALGDQVRELRDWDPSGVKSTIGTLETVKHHLRPPRQPSGGPRQRAATRVRLRLMVDPVWLHLMLDTPAHAVAVERAERGFPCSFGDFPAHFGQAASTDTVLVFSLVT